MTITLKVMAWNIVYGHYASLEKIAEYIGRTEAQIVFLSEIDRNTGRSGYVDQPAKLAELLNLPFWRFWGPNGDTGKNGVAVLSAFPLDPVTPNEVVDFKTPDYIVQTSTTINNIVHYLFANHFHYANPCLRLADARRQNAIVNALPSHSAVIMAGDLNSKPLSPVVSTLKQTLTEAFLQLASYNSGEVDRRIDYIFFRGPYQVKSYDLNDHWDLGPQTGSRTRSPGTSAAWVRNSVGLQGQSS
jgi:endonuclease/exonuclease/phosphatase family metal-dependent hydrolase